MTSNHHDSAAPSASRRGLARWPLFLIGSPAAVAVWSGWVGIAKLTGFGMVSPLPGIWPSLHLDTSITLPVGVEAYAAYALRAWLASPSAAGPPGGTTPPVDSPRRRRVAASPSGIRTTTPTTPGRSS